MAAIGKVVIEIHAEVNQESLDRARRKILEELGAPVYIMSTHRHAFRPDQWALITGVVIVPAPWERVTDTRPPRPCYVVRFVDGEQDLWPIYDPDHAYVFSDTAVEGDEVFRMGDTS